MLKKIVSGGQAGVDRGALEAAMANGVSYGGWVPRGRRAEDGVVPAIFTELREGQASNYLWRTEQNMIDSDATLVLSPDAPDRLSPGSRRTVEFAHKHGRPVRVCILTPELKALSAVAAWVHDGGFETLNIAGPRESKHPGVQALTAKYVAALIEKLREFDDEEAAPPMPMAADPAPDEVAR